MMLLKKVKKTIETGSLLKKGDSVLCAVSGGADSVCLLHILQQLKNEYDLTIYAANVNHLIRGEESNRDSGFVKQLCENLNVHCFYREYDVKKIAKKRKIGEEECGRILRYEFFDEISKSLNGAKIATAHNLNDNAETVLFRLIRGSSSLGLSGIQKKRGLIIRPLLDVNRKEIEEFLLKNNISWCEDSTNKIPVYTRNKLRLSIIPQLNEIVENSENHMVSAARIISDDNSYLSKLSEGALEKCFFEEYVSLDEFLAYDISIQRRMASSILSAWKTKEITNEKIEDFINFFKKDTGKRFVISADYYAEKSYNRIILVMNNSVCSKHLNILSEGVYKFNEYSLYFKKTRELPKKRNNNIAVFDAEKLSFPMTVRTKTDGDKMTVKGMTGYKKISDIFTDEKIERNMRKRVPIVLKNEEIVFLPGIRQSAKFSVDDKTENYLIIERSE